MSSILGNVRAAPLTPEERSVIDLLWNLPSEEFAALMAITRGIEMSERSKDRHWTMRHPLDLTDAETKQAMQLLLKDSKRLMKQWRKRQKVMERRDERP